MCKGQQAQRQDAVREGFTFEAQKLLYLSSRSIPFAVVNVNSPPHSNCSAFDRRRLNLVAGVAWLLILGACDPDDWG